LKAKHGLIMDLIKPDILDLGMSETPPGTELEEVSPAGDPGQAIIVDLPESSLAPEDEIITAIMADPLIGPVFATVMEVHRELNQVSAELRTFKADTVSVFKDLNDSIAYLQAVPSHGQDLIGAFDRFVEKYGLQDNIKGIFSAGQTAMLSLAGADPVASNLGAEFMEEVKALKLEKDRAEIEAMALLRQALSRGEKVYLLSPEEEEQARKEGFLKEGPSEAGSEEVLG